MTDPVEFVDVFRRTLTQHAKCDNALAEFVEALSGVTAVRQNYGTYDGEHSLLDLLNDVLGDASGPTEMIDAVAVMASTAGWYQTYGGDGIDAAMASSMLAKQVVGPRGLIASESMRTGLFLLAPDFVYPMHEHAATEVYYVHSGTIDIQNGIDSAPRCVHAGEYSVTPSATPHALYTRDEPVLILYVWSGDVTAPIWWWIENENGDWTKEFAKNP